MPKKCRAVRARKKEGMLFLQGSWSNIGNFFNPKPAPKKYINSYQSLYILPISHVATLCAAMSVSQLGFNCVASGIFDDRQYGFPGFVSSHPRTVIRLTCMHCTQLFFKGNYQQGKTAYFQHYKCDDNLEQTQDR